MESNAPQTPMMSTLLALPLFQGLTLEQLMRVLEKAVPEFIYLSDEPILLRGDRHKRILLILKGRISRRHTDAQGVCTLHETLREGEMIEFTSLFGKSTLVGADYYAEGEVTLLAFDKQYLFTVFNRFDIIQMNLLNLCCARTQALQAKLTAKVGDTVAERFLHLVDTLSDNPYGEKVLAVSRAALADLLGVSRRPMSTEIVKWEQAGLIRLYYAQILIPDLPTFRSAVLS